MTEILRALAIVGAMAAVMSIGPARAEDRPWPTQGWDSATPEEAGFDSARLAEALSRIAAEEPATHAVFVAVDGRAILDATFYPYAGDQPHNVASVTKSVMTTLIAIAADQGKLTLDQPMLDFFPDREVANLDDRKRRITVRHLTGMVSGLACVGEHDEPTLHEMNASPDWIQFTLDLPMAAEPGEVFSYCSPGMHLLSAILQKATGQTALDYAHAELFAPLGITSAAWPADPQGITHGWGDLQLFPQDAARIGYLWLNGGEWAGRQIVPRDWVEASSRKQVTTGANWGDDYGLGWWVPVDQTFRQFAAAGRGGQRIAVFPDLRIVAVTAAGGVEPGRVLDLIGTAMVSPGTALPANPAGEASLRLALSRIGAAPSPSPVPDLPPLAQEISGRTWMFAENPLGMRSLTVRFDDSAEAGFEMTFADGSAPRDGRVGLDGVLRMFPGEDGVTAGMRGRWDAEGRFHAEYDGIGFIDAFDLTLEFQGDRLIMTAKDRTYEQGVTLEGRAD